MAWATRDASPIYRTPAHRKARTALLKAYQPGDPCCLCGHAMWPTDDGKTSHLHADHDPETGGYRGLAHGNPIPCQDCGALCNQSDGARRGLARRGVTRLQW